MYKVVSAERVVVQHKRGVPTEKLSDGLIRSVIDNQRWSWKVGSGARYFSQIGLLVIVSIGSCVIHGTTDKVSVNG
jgi:hypothetical protein